MYQYNVLKTEIHLCNLFYLSTYTYVFRYQSSTSYWSNNLHKQDYTNICGSSYKPVFKEPDCDSGNDNFIIRKFLLNLKNPIFVITC